MLQKLAIIGVSVCWAVFAIDQSPQKIEVSKTEKIDFKSGGVLRLTNSIGNLTIEGWDQPQVEITSVKSTKKAFSAAESAKGSAELDKVHITAERKGDEVVIAEDFPRHRPFPPSNPWGAGTNFDLDTRIRAPRDTKLVIAGHDVGEIHVDDLINDIDVTLLQGAVTLHLPENGSYAINARTDFGNVNCDFPGGEKRRGWLTGHEWAGGDSQGAHKLNLKVGYGDVVILKTQIPKAPPSLLNAPRAGNSPNGL